MSLDIEPRTQTTFIGTVDASTTPTYTVFKAPAACKVVTHKIYVTATGAVVAHATNVHTSTFNRVRAASATAIATQTTDSDIAGSAAIAANVPWNVPLTSDALAQLNAGDIIQWAPTEGGAAASGDLAGAAVTVEYSLGTGAGNA
jgi:hypothetical protein